MSAKRPHKEKRLHEGGVGPEMRSPAGLRAAILRTQGPLVNRQANGRGSDRT